jgi:hypothetical protein
MATYRLSLLLLMIGSLGIAGCKDELASPRKRNHPAQASALSAPPEYLVAHARKAPEIDGRIDDEAWRSASAVLLRNSFNGSPVTLRTELRMLYDREFLYLAFDCEDPDVWGSFRQRDEPLYTQEVVELFVDADGDGRAYQELQVSPHNVIFDAFFPSRRQGMDLSFDSGIVSAAAVNGTIDQPSDVDRGWTVEAKVPLKTFAPEVPLEQRAGKSWRFNAYRLELLQRRVTEGQAFSPLYQGDFHNLPRFGLLRFGSL